MNTKISFCQQWNRFYPRLGKSKEKVCPQYSCLEYHGQKSLVGYSSSTVLCSWWTTIHGSKELDTTEHITLSSSLFTYLNTVYFLQHPLSSQYTLGNVSTLGT